MNTALGVLRRLTAGLREVSVPPIADSIVPNIVLAENYAFHEPYFVTTPQLYRAAISRNLQQGSEVTAAAYIQSRRELDEARRAIGAAFSDVDLLVTPTTPVPPPTIEEAVRLGIEVGDDPQHRHSFNVYGLPTISIPCGFTQFRAAHRYASQRATLRGGQGADARARAISRQLTGTQGGLPLSNL